MTTTTRAKAAGLGLFVSDDGFTILRERRFGSELVRNVSVRDEDGNLAAEHVTIETTKRHRNRAAASAGVQS
jgi:hypothetical protein